MRCAVLLLLVAVKRFRLLLELCSYQRLSDLSCAILFGAARTGWDRRRRIGDARCEGAEGEGFGTFGGL